MMRPAPGGYKVTTSALMSPDEASRDLFPPDALIVHVETYRRGPLVTYCYLVDYKDPD